MSAAATRDDLVSVVTALTEQAATQRKWEQEYEAKAGREFVVAHAAGTTELARAQALANRDLWQRFAATARASAHAFEVSADMISKYVGVGYTRVVDGVTG